MLRTVRRLTTSPCTVVTDHADRKMVAGVLAAGGRAGGCTLVNSCDTDWYDWQSALEGADVFVDQLNSRMVPPEMGGKASPVSQFFRFPRTPHLAWLGDALPRDDKLLSASEAHALLAEDVAVEEKLDGPISEYRLEQMES